MQIIHGENGRRDFLNKFTKTHPLDPKNDDVIAMLVPKWKGSATIQWRDGPWNASVNATYQTDIRTGATATAAQYAAFSTPPDYINPSGSITTSASAP